MMAAISFALQPASASLRAAALRRQQTLRIQMRGYISGRLRIKGFHPHVIRKIVPKIILDEDPNAMEIVRRIGGWKGDKTVRRSYLQKRNRIAQARYADMLDARRLGAIKRAYEGGSSDNAS